MSFGRNELTFLKSNFYSLKALEVFTLKMAKRTLGLGKAAKERKKQKSEPAAEKLEKPTKDVKEPSPDAPKPNEINVELEEGVDPDDEIVQLKGLWNTYAKSDRDDELLLNGIIHECDLLLRNQNDDMKLPSEFHSIYALALSELAVFHTEGDEEEKDDKKNDAHVKQYFDAALERVELGQEEYPDSIELNFTKARILLNRIPLEFISNYNLETVKGDDTPEISKLLDNALDAYEKAEESVKLLENYSLLGVNVFETLKALDDLLEIVRNFGKTDIGEGLDSDAEDEDEEHVVKLSKKHPLYKVHKSEKYFEWLIKHGEEFGDNVLKEHSPLLKKKDLDDKEASQLAYLKEVSLKIGQLLLQAAEKPAGIFTTITYDSDVEDDSEIEGYTAKKAQKEAVKYTKKAVDFFRVAEDEEDPQAWVDYAEAVISLGNLYDYESKDQEEAYAIAEKKLKRANNATNGKYKSILDNMLEG